MDADEKTCAKCQKTINVSNTGFLICNRCNITCHPVCVGERKKESQPYVYKCPECNKQIDTETFDYKTCPICNNTYKARLICNRPASNWNYEEMTIFTRIKCTHCGYPAKSISIILTMIAVLAICLSIIVTGYIVITKFQLDKGSAVMAMGFLCIMPAFLVFGFFRMNIPRLIFRNSLTKSNK